ncbi:MAG: hypothetical protein QOF78_4429 [Phycisphaerales bacterium]|jgi:hypothetical protein|nr:hypothetical protein [Phycisphaerales bacterium]
MPNPPPFTPLKPRVHRKRRAAVAAGPPPPLALTLISADYADVDTTLTLVFDRAIDIGGLDGNEIKVDDQPLGVRFLATGAAMLLAPTTVRIELVEDGGIPDGDDVFVNASAASGIIAVAPPVGGTWGGATDLSLPFP